MDADGNKPKETGITLLSYIKRLGCPMQITRIFMRYILRQILSLLMRVDTLVVSLNIMLQQFRRPYRWIRIMTSHREQS